MDRGIILGSDSKTEWLLPWWWKCYSFENDFPVTFIDFGMSRKMLDWCRLQGAVKTLSFDANLIAKKSSISPARIERWEAQYGKRLWRWRLSWFKKPFAMMQSPYDLSIWLDVDCEVCKHLGPLFEALNPSADVAMAAPESNDYYNSGVVVFRKNNALIRNWAALCLSKNAQVCGDDQVFNLPSLRKPRFQRLADHFNWMAWHQINFGASIIHWHTPQGKRFIQKHGGFREMAEKLGLRATFG